MRSKYPYLKSLMKQAKLTAHECSGCYVSEYKYTVFCAVKQGSLFGGQQPFSEMLFNYIQGKR